MLKCRHLHYTLQIWILQQWYMSMITASSHGRLRQHIQVTVMIYGAYDLFTVNISCIPCPFLHPSTVCDVFRLFTPRDFLGLICVHSASLLSTLQQCNATPMHYRRAMTMKTRKVVFPCPVEVFVDGPGSFKDGIDPGLVLANSYAEMTKTERYGKGTQSTSGNYSGPLTTRVQKLYPAGHGIYLYVYSVYIRTLQMEEACWW